MMKERVQRLRRCQLAVPASNERMIQKAVGGDADFVFLDLEDAVAAKAKPQARGNAVRALKNLEWNKTTRCVRINDLTTPYWLDDIIEVVSGAGDHLDVLMVPKVMSATDVRIVDAVLTQLETKLGLSNEIGLDLLIEEVQALQCVEEIAHSSLRVEALIFGLGDYSASQGIDLFSQMSEHHYPGDVFHYARFRTVMAARSAGLDAVDGPYPSFQDREGFRQECEQARILGFVGKWAIHPAQIPIAADVFTPTQAFVDKARRHTEAYHASVARGEGAVSVDGVMADAATVRLMANTLRMADLIGM